jgi:hypothetical protein
MILVELFFTLSFLSHNTNHFCFLSCLEGLSHVSSFTYKLNQSATIPIRWSAPEVFLHGRLSKPRDVWAFDNLPSVAVFQHTVTTHHSSGVTAWEIFD